MITKLEIEQYTLQEINNTFNGAIERWIDETVKYMETFLNHDIVPTDTETRLFDGSNTHYLLIGNAHEIDTVVIDGIETETVSYPANTEQKYKLYTKLGFKKGIQNVAVTGKWGYETYPADLKFACLVLVSGIVKNQVNKDLSSESIGNYSLSYSTDAQRDDFKRAMDILTMYRTHVI